MKLQFRLRILSCFKFFDFNDATVLEHRHFVSFKLKVAWTWILRIMTVGDNLGRYMIYSLVVFIDVCAAVCLFMCFFVIKLTRP